MENFAATQYVLQLLREHTSKNKNPKQTTTMKRVSTFLAALLCTASAIFADLPFRNHRYDAFKPLPVTSENIVFIGNSITNMHEWWEAFGDANVVNRGVSGAITDEALENIEAIAAGKPKKVFLLIGTNDLGTAGICTTEHVLQNVTLMVERFQKVSPETKLYIQSILPSGHLGSGGTRTPERLKATNVALKTLCEERNITYIDLWDDLQDIATGANEFSYDKLHLTANAYKVWCDKIAPYVTDKADAKSLYSDKQQSNGGLGGSHGMRATVFSKLPVNSTDILILGDGTVHGGEWHELLQSDRVKGRGTGWGFPGASLADATKLIEPTFHDGATPAQVYLHMAASDVLGSTELATILTNYKAAVAKIQQLSANTEIVLTSILPTNDATKNSNRVVEFNKLLKAYADESTTDKIHYLDIYTDLVKDGKANTALFNGNYLYGRGYVKVAQKIAEQINTLEPTANITAITDATAEELFTRFDSRTALGKAIVTASLLPEGDGVGQYTTANLTGVKAQIETAYTALKNNDADAIANNAAAFTAAVNELLPKINMPIYSTEKDEVWYQLNTPGRGNKYLASTGAGAGVVGVDKDNYPTSMWKFVNRGDGKGLDIINRHDKSFLAPTASHNTQLKTSATQPANGWTLSYSNAAGRFIVASGTVQLNQTDKAGTPVYNWGGGTDRGDTGCQYQVTLVENEPDEMPDPSEMTLTLGIDQFANGASTWTKNVSTSDGWYGKFVTGTTPAVTVESTNTAVNNMGWSNKRPWMQTGYSYTISLPKGLIITGYELTTLEGGGFNGTFTYTTADGTATSPVQTATAQTVKAKGLSTQTVTLKVGEGTNGDKGIMITNLVIRYKQAEGVEEEVLPTEISYTVDKTNGNLYKGTTANQSWNNVWKSNTTPQLQFGCGTINNMNWSGNNVQLMTGTAGKATYTLTAPAGYVITEYSFTFANNNHNTALNLTMDNGEAFQTGAAQTISASKVKVGSVAFTLEGSNGSGVVLTNFTVKVKVDKVEAPTISTEENEYWYYITSAAANKAYCNGKVMYYDAEMGKMRFGEKTFSADRIWSFWEKDGKLAIKNYKGEYFGTAPSGTGNTTSFGVVSEPNYIYNIKEAHGFFVIKDDKVEFHAQESNQVIVRWAAEAGGASLWKFEEVDTSHSLAELANSKVEQGKISTGIGNTDQAIIRSTVRISGLEGKVTFQGVKGTYTGTDKADVTKVKAYFATNARELFVDPEKKMTWRDENGEQYGEAVTLAEDGTFTITGSKEMVPGDYYLWITFDVAETAKEGNLVDATITSYTIDGKEVQEKNGNPQYGATIFLSEGAALMPMDKGTRYYRIPAITVTRDGKRLVILTDDRKSHGSDLPSHCYIVAQYSDDLGKSWSEPVTVAGTAETGGDYGHGDASIVTNRDNGEIVGIMTSAGTYGHGFFAGTAAEPPRWKTITSRDGGLTWEKPVDHTDDLYGANCDNPVTKTWKSGFSGSGAALQKRDGTLVSSFVNRAADNSQNFHFFMSKDGGKSWYVSGVSGTTKADEPKTLERNNGDLAISVRASGYNYYNYTSDDGATWHLPAETRFTSGISGNACDGEYMVWCSTVEGNPWDIAFQTIPNHNQRQNVSIALSTDEGATFGTPKTICPRGSTYSAAVVLPDGTLGVYYEENGVYDGFVMRFVRFSLDWASNGKYKFTEENPFKPIKSTNPTDIEVETTDNGQQTTDIYDLQGRRVENPTKGIYIVNGRKVVIK